jgi:LPXTG-site transpeptidase (sortase) family protein
MKTITYNSFSARSVILSLLVGLFILASAGLVVIHLWPFFALSSSRSAYSFHLPLAQDRGESFTDQSLIRQPYPPLLNGDLSETSGSWIRIPSIGVNVPLVLSSSMNDHDVLKVLDQGAALYPNGVLPGQIGNAFIAAHSTGEPWKGAYRFAFLDIDKVQEGHLIHLDWHGTRYTYRVVNSEVITPDPDFRVVSDRQMPSVTLMACWPLWSTSKRMLVHGELTNITKLTPGPS